jgi:STE24 endopeptidase
MQAQCLRGKFPGFPATQKNCLRFGFLVFAFQLWICHSVSGQARTPGNEPRSTSSLIPRPRPEIIVYNRTHYALYFAGTAWGFLGLGLAVRFRLGRRILDVVDSRMGFSGANAVSHLPFKKSVVRTAVYFSLLALLLMFWRLPLGLVSYGIERSFGFATLSVYKWFGDRILGFLFGLSSIPAVWFGYWLIQRSPKRWWLWLWVGSIPWTIATAVIVPLVVDPVYNHFVPLENGPLKSDIIALAHKAGIREVNVLRVDSSKRTTKVNAYVSGIGPFTRIVIWDTTLNKLTHDELLAILGHEMGHYALHHIWRNVVIGIGGAFCILFLFSRILTWSVSRFGSLAGIRGIHDLAGLPLALLILNIMLFVQTPIESAISRYNEHEADRYGLELTRLNEATARAFAGFVEQNYSDPDPPKVIVFWLYSHPPTRERVEFALSYKPHGQ